MSARLEGQARYRVVASELLGEIRAGKYADGKMLPSEDELCRIYSVSRITIRAALRELQVRGIISRRSGIGTWVESIDGRSRFVQESSSIEEILQFTAQLDFKLHEITEIEADESLAEQLRSHPFERFIRVIGIRLPADGGLPVCLSTHYVPAAFAAVVKEFDGIRESLAVLIASRFGEAVAAINQVFDAINLSEGEAVRLGENYNDAALRIRRCYRSENGGLILASHSVYPKSRFSYAMELTRSVTPSHAG